MPVEMEINEVSNEKVKETKNNFLTPCTSSTFPLFLVTPQALTQNLPVWVSAHTSRGWNGSGSDDSDTRSAADPSEILSHVVKPLLLSLLVVVLRLWQVRLRWWRAGPRRSNGSTTAA